jgi:uncharacterized membrane protein
MKPSIRLVYTIVILLSLIGAAVVVRRTLNLVPVLVNGYHEPAPATNSTIAQFRKADDIFARYPVLTLIHILPALLFIAIGPFQFNKNIRNKYPKWHRRMGRVFLICGMIIGITGFVMSIVMPAIGGVNQAASTVMFSVFFLYALYKAFRHIRNGNSILHCEWMIRAYAIGLAVATIRPIVAVFFATSRFTGLTPYEFFGTGFWIGFVLHLIIAEAWINHTREPLPNIVMKDKVCDATAAS